MKIMRILRAKFSFYEHKKKVIQDYLSGSLDRSRSLSELEYIYGIIPTSKPGDRLRKWLKWFDQKGKHLNQYAPGELLSTLASKGKDIEVNLCQDKEDKELKNLTLKSTWQVQKKGGDIEWLESYQNNVKPEDIKAFREELIRDIPSIKKSFTPREKTEYGSLAVISIPDFHIGREQDPQINNDKFLDTVNNLLVKVSHHIIEEIVFVIGNDYFNSDFDYKTTKGTPQFDYQNWKQTWNNGRDILVSAIDILKNKKCRINVINIPGNHDVMRAFLLGDYVEGYYRNDDQIIVDNSDRLVKVFKYHNVLLGFEHGEFRQTEYESILANEYPELWGSSTYREFLCGHLHAETVKEFRGLKLRHLPSLANESDWEKKQGYKHKKESQVLVYSKDKLEAIYIE